MLTLYTAVFFFLVIVIDFRIVLQSKDKKEVIVYTVCLAISLVVVILRSLYVQLPDPGEWIINGLKSLSLL